VGALLLVWSREHLSWADLTTIVVIGFLGHFIVRRVGYWLGVRDVKL
jgi:hypothetical protein